MWGNGISVKVCYCGEGGKIMFNLTSVEQLMTIFKSKMTYLYGVKNKAIIVDIVTRLRGVRL